MWLPLMLLLGPLLALSPERVLVLEDTSTHNFERTLVHQQLMSNLLREPATQLVTHGSPPANLVRASQLKEQADLMLQQARRALHALNLPASVTHASASLLRYNRVALLSGDLSGLIEALTLSAAAHLLQDHQSAADSALAQLLTLDPEFMPSAKLFNRAMQQSVQQARRRLQNAQRDVVQLKFVTALSDATLAQRATQSTAVFVDGSFVGFGEQALRLVKSTAHHIWVVPPSGFPQGIIHESAKKGAKPIREILVPMWPSPQDVGQRGGEPQFGHVLAASRLPSGEIDPYHRSLASRKIDTVLVLAYAEGALRLTTFELRRGKRRTRRALAAVTHLTDVTRLTGILMDPTPPLAAVP